VAREVDRGVIAVPFRVAEADEVRQFVAAEVDVERAALDAVRAMQVRRLLGRRHFLTRKRVAQHEFAGRRPGKSGLPTARSAASLTAPSDGQQPRGRMPKVFSNCAIACARCQRTRSSPPDTRPPPAVDSRARFARGLEIDQQRQDRVA